MHFRSIADHNGNLKSLAVLFLQFSVENQNKSHQNDNKNPDKMGSAVKTHRGFNNFLLLCSRYHFASLSIISYSTRLYLNKTSSCPLLTIKSTSHGVNDNYWLPIHSFAFVTGLKPFALPISPTDALLTFLSSPN